MQKKKNVLNRMSLIRGVPKLCDFQSLLNSVACMMQSAWFLWLAINPISRAAFQLLQSRELGGKTLDQSVWIMEIFSNCSVLYAGERFYSIYFYIFFFSEKLYKLSTYDNDMSLKNKFKFFKVTVNLKNSLK